MGDPDSDPDPPPGSPSDGAAWDLVTRARDGDRDAFAGLYDRYVEPVFRFLFFRLGDRAQAEELTSETFLRAYRRLDSLTYRGTDPGAWFITIARNLVLDHHKAARTRREQLTDDVHRAGFGPPDDRPGPEQTALDRMETERVLHHLGQLGEDQRECVVLRFLQDLSVAETARIMGRNEGAIKALQHRALRRLAALIRADDS